MSDSAIKHATNDTFAAMVVERSAEVPVLVDFWAEWCGPCKAVAPVLEELAGRHAGKFEVVKVDVDANGKSAQDHGIQGIPTMVIYSGGKEVDRRVGALDLASCEEFVKPHFSAA